MALNFDGASSGDKYDYRPKDINVKYSNQPPANTASNKSYPTIQYTQTTGNRDGDASPPVPNCGTPDDSAV